MRTVDREQDPEQALRLLKDLGGKMTECKRCAAPPPSRLHLRRESRKPVAVLHFWGATLSHTVVCTFLFWRSLIREFEKEARADGQDANAVQRKKTVRVPHRCLLSRRTEAQRLRSPRHTGSDGPKPLCGTLCAPCRLAGPREPTQQVRSSEEEED